jgi:hypothetical protein
MIMTLVKAMPVKTVAAYVGEMTRVVRIRAPLRGPSRE